MADFYYNPLTGERYHLYRPFKHEGRQYTRSGATEETFLELGFVPVTQQTRPDDRFHYVVGPDNYGFFTTNPKPLGPIKEELIKEQRTEANRLLSSTDWMVVRAIDDPEKPVSDEIQQFRASVRSICSGRVDAIKAATTHEELEALVTNPAIIYNHQTETRITNPQPHLTPYPYNPTDTEFS